MKIKFLLAAAYLCFTGINALSADFPQLKHDELPTKLLLQGGDQSYPFINELAMSPSRGAVTLLEIPHNINRDLVFDDLVRQVQKNDAKGRHHWVDRSNYKVYLLDTHHRIPGNDIETGFESYIVARGISEADQSYLVALARLKGKLPFGHSVFGELEEDNPLFNFHKGPNKWNGDIPPPSRSFVQEALKIPELEELMEKAIRIEAIQTVMNTAKKTGGVPNGLTEKEMKGFGIEVEKFIRQVNNLNKKHRAILNKLTALPQPGSKSALKKAAALFSAATRGRDINPRDLIGARGLGIRGKHVPTSSEVVLFCEGLAQNAKGVSRAVKGGLKSAGVLKAVLPVLGVAGALSYADQAYAYSTENNVCDESFENGLSDNGLNSHPSELKAGASRIEIPADKVQH